MLAAAALLGALLVIAVIYLWPEWRTNPDLSHGLFTPLLFLVLLREAHRGRVRWIPSRAWSAALALAFLAGGLALLALGSAFAVALDWTHPLARYLIGLALVAALAAALATAAAADRRWQPLNWPSVAAIVLWWLSLPLPPGTYARITLQLQLGVTEAVLTSLHWLGIPASRVGNIIELGHTSVGVEDACSGIRSLLSCVYAGVFLSATLVSRTRNRVLVLLLAPVLAVGMNFARSLLLTLLARNGTDISGTWHDVTGFGILALTAALLGAMGVGLGRRERSPDGSRLAGPTASAPALAGRDRLAWILAGGYALALVWAITLLSLTRPVRAAASAPDLAAMLPTATAGWDHVATDDLYAYTPILQTNHVVQRTYLREDVDGITQLTVYLAYWAPAQAPVSVVASHTPDLCWPGSGWEPDPAASDRRTLPLPSGRTLAPAEYRRFHHERLPQHVWFWHVYEHRVIASPDALSPLDLLRSVWRFGVRSRGEQLFVRVSSNQPWDVIRDEPLVQDLFDQLHPFGL